jgi:type I restriction enzyme S subunit
MGVNTKLNDQLPDNWISKAMGEVCDFLKGKKPKNTGHKSETRTVPYINIKAFESGVPEEFAERGNYPDCSRDDVLIVWDGARAGLVGRGVSGYIGSTLSKVWSKATNNKYLYYFLKLQYKYINTNTKGVGIPHVDSGILYSIKFPIAPMNEQVRIVNEIEKQFSRLDDAVAALKRIKANLKRYKTSVLKAAVEGKLTEEWRSSRGERPFAPTESGADLLKRILVERKKKWEKEHPGKKYKQPAVPDTSNLPKLPKGWVWAGYAQVGQLQLGRQRAPRYHSGKNMRPYLRVQNVFEDRIDLSDVMEMDFPPADFERYKLTSGDLLLNEGQSPELLGRPAIYRDELPCACFTNTLIRFRAMKGVSIEFALIVSRYNMHAGRFIDEGTITTNIAHLSVGRLSTVEFPLPSIDEQKEIVAEVDRCLSIVTGVDAQVDANLKRADRLRQSILRKAFSGRLIY